MRTQGPLRGWVRITAELVGNELFKLTVWSRTWPPSQAREESRDQALMRSLVSAHTVLGVTDGRFVSLTDPPADLLELAQSCRNIGVWPVLVGAEGDRDTNAFFSHHYV